MTFPNDFNGDYTPTDLIPTNEWMQTFTGKAVFPNGHVTTDDIDIYDIAHSLGMQCRYNGHTKVFYSVAEHCIHMSYVVPAEDALWALLHDGTEAYVGDLIRPLKKLMPDYVTIEDRIMVAIVDKFELGTYEMPASVREADNRIIENERLALMSSPPMEWTCTKDGPLPNVAIQAWTPDEAEFRYFNRFQELMFMRGNN